MKSWLMRIAVLLAVLTVLLWIYVSEVRIRSLQGQVRMLVSVSPGMLREEVVARLGEPTYVESGAGVLDTGGDALVYKWYDTWPSSEVCMVLLDERDRAVAVFFPKRSRFPPIGGIVPVSRSSNGNTRK